MKVKVAKWGNSLGMRLPRAAAAAAGVEAGTEFEITIEGQDLRLRRARRIPYYRLEDLIAEMDRLGPENRPEVDDWGPDVGAEIIDDDYSRGRLQPPSGGYRVGRSQADAGTGAGRRKTRGRAHGS